MNTYQIFIKTADGWMYYSKSPIYSQVLAVTYQLQEKGFETRLRKNGRWIA